MLSRSVVLGRPVASQLCRLFSSTSSSSSGVGVSKLDNGITVVSLDNDSEVSALGVFVKAGSRYETFDTNGSAHFIKHSAYQSTQSLSAIRITRLLESLSNNYSVDAGREGIQYKAETLRSQAPELLAILGDQMRPRLAEWEVRDQRERVMSDRNRLLSDAKSATCDAVHFTAYRGAGLGRPSIAPSFQIESLTHDALQQYVENEFVGQRIVVAGVGIDHDTLVSNVTKSFGYLPAGTPQVEGASQYTGGESLSVGCGHGTRVSLTFNGVSFRSSDHVAAHALGLVLGGGTQSRGTLGSGVTSRLYQALTQNPLLRAASTWNACYSDSGLFGLHGYATTGNATAVIELFAAQLRALKNDISDEEAARAVSLARAAVLSSTETRLGTIEFLGKQALAGNGTFVSPSDFVASTQFNVSSADLKKLASKILTSNPTLVVAGDIAGIPTLESVRKLL